MTSGMVKIWFICLGAGVCIFLTISDLAAGQYTAEVTKIIDGDSIVVNYKNQSVKVRLWGIDTPEYKQAYSKAAKKLVT